MANVKVVKPQAGESQTIPSEAGANFIFDFPGSEASLVKDGDNLQINFQDGSSLNLENFYTQYNSENLPTFEIDGEEITAEQFFQAMNEPDLMPAAGPGTGTASNGGRFHDFGNSALAAGIEHLERLDWHTDRSFEPQTADWITYPDREGDDEGNRVDQTVAPTPVNHPVTLTPINPERIPEGTPELPGDDSGNPGGNPGGSPSVLELGNDVRLIKESDLDNGNKPSVDGAFKIDAPDGLAAITVAGVNIWQNGVMDANARFNTHEGYFHNFAYNAETGVLTYTYTLERATQEHGAQGQDNIAHSLPISATDVDGDVAHGMATIVIEDDMPTINATVEAPKSVVETSVLINFTGQNGNTLGDFQNLFASQDEKWNAEKLDSDLYNLHDNKQENVHFVIVNGIKLIPTHVKYEIDADGNYLIDNFQDNNAKVISDQGDSADRFTDKVLNLTPEGIGMGTQGSSDNNWGGNEFGTYGEINNNIGQSDGFVIEPDNGSVWYQLDIDLANFADGDRAVIYFYLTPQNNNDDNIVYSKIITADDLHDGKQSIQIPMPDGFTKAIIAPIPQEDGEPSNFIVSQLNFSKNAYEHNGSVAADFGADGAVDGIVWDWSGITEALQDKSVQVHETPGAGEYTVNFQTSADGLTIKAVLAGDGNGGISLNGNPLFIINYNPEDGSWKIDQFYKYSCDGVDISKLQFTVSAKDADGDEVTSTVNVNMQLQHGLDRFDNVELGYYDKDNWSWQAEKDYAFDLLSGKEGNDLMYGRGGNDIMFGDDAENKALGDLVGILDKHVTTTSQNKDFNADVAGNFKPLDKADEYSPGSENNKNAHNEILLNGLNELRNSADDVRNGNLNAALKEFEALEQKGGDDAMYGGLGRDILFGGAGDDYLVGSGDKDAKNPPDDKYKIEDQDMLFGGSGNDIIVFDPGDFIIHGGSGIDVLLAGNATTYTDPWNHTSNIGHLWEIQDNYNLNKAYVDSMEVLIRSENSENVETLGITSQTALKNYGVNITGDSMTLSDAWESSGESYSAQNAQGLWVTYHTYKYKGENGVELTLETSLQPGEDGIFREVPPAAIGPYNDIIAYENIGQFYDGGKGIDLILANADSLPSNAYGIGGKSTLRQLTLVNKTVNNVEMMLVGKGQTKVEDLGIITQNALAAYGISIIGDNIYIDDTRWNADNNQGGDWGSHNSGEFLANARLYSFSYNHDGVELGLQIIRTDGIENGVPHINKGLPPVEPTPQNDEPPVDSDGPMPYDLRPNDPDDDDTQPDVPNPSADANHPGGAAGADQGSGGNQSVETQDFLAQVEALGGDKESALIFGNDDDFIMDGDKDSVFAGGGNDLIVYDESDFLIDGGSGIDILLADADSRYSLADMLDNFNNHGGDKDMPMVNDVEILLKGDMNDIHNLQDLHDKFGISLGKDGDNNTITLDGSWQKAEGKDNVIEHRNDRGDVDATIETTMDFTETLVNDTAILVATQQVQSETGGAA